MAKNVMNSQLREDKGKNKMRRLRKAGFTPGIIFGRSGETTPISFEVRDLEKILYSESGFNTIFTLVVEGGKKKEEFQVMVKEYQLEPVSHQFLHVSFYRIHMDRLMEVSVPINIIGVAHGVKTQGGRLDVVSREVSIQCLPGDIPEHFDVDISEMAIHDTIRVGDIEKSDKYEFTSDPKTVILHVLPPRKVEDIISDEDDDDDEVEAAAE